MTLQKSVSRSEREEYAPNENQHGRRDAEGDHVGERIQFAAKVTGGVCHARDAAIETVEQDGERQRLGSDREMRIRCEIARPGEQCALKGLQDRNETQENIRASEKGWQGISSPAWAFPGDRRTGKTLSNTQTVSPSRARRARIVLPPKTLSPILASSFQSGPNITSTREPNLM
jgi:hypothetical protein